MINKIGDLFWEMGSLSIIIDKDDSQGIMYWICEDLSGQSSGPLWVRDEEVTEGKKELLDLLNKTG